VYAVSIIAPFVIPNIFIQLYGKLFVVYLMIHFAIHKVLSILHTEISDTMYCRRECKI
jgi:hypothetical protein